MGTDAATKTAAQKATARPWTISDYFSHTIVDVDGNEIADITGAEASFAEDAANTALIVRAVNAHDELLAALKDVLRIAKAASIGVTGNAKRIAAAEAAIAAAEGSAP